MARRPFDPAERGWAKTEYRQGDILDRDAVEALVADADVVVHLAFIIMGSREESARVNLTGTRNVFEATVAADRPRRLVYTSSVAAYGYHSDNPIPITEDVPPRGSPEHYYSEQKAACEAVLAELTADSTLEVFILRPCIVAGPKAHALAEAMPWNRLPGLVRRVSGSLPLLKAPFPDPGTPMQLVHHDDVAAAIALATTTSAPPGAYNLAGDGVLSLSDVAEALGARPIRVPHAAVTAASEAHRPAAVRPVGARVAACRTDVGGHGHRQGEVKAGMDTEIHRRRDVVGAGRVDVVTACGPRCRPGHSVWPRPHRTSRHLPSAAFAGSLCTSSSASSGPTSDSAVSGFSLFTDRGLPAERGFHSVAATTQLVRPILWHPAAGPGDGLVLRAADRRGEFGPVVVLVGLVIPEPVLAGFERADDRVTGFPPMRRRVTGQRIVATPDVAAGRAAA